MKITNPPLPFIKGGDFPLPFVKPACPALGRDRGR